MPRMAVVMGSHRRIQGRARERERRFLVETLWRKRFGRQSEGDALEEPEAQVDRTGW